MIYSRQGRRKFLMAFDLMVPDPLRPLRRLLNARAALLFAGLLATAAVSDARAIVSVSGDDAKPDAGNRQRVIEGVVRNLKEHYVDRDIAQKMADVLLAREKNGDDKATTDGAAFADLLTRQLREVSHDMHLEVVYSQERLPDHPGTPSPEGLANYRRASRASRYSRTISAI
jgi:N-terminal domain of Peptidase_S41 in eukaryotic IRBP